MHQEPLTVEEKIKLAQFEDFLRNELPQMYLGVLLLMCQSIAKGNLKILQEKLAMIALEMDTLNSGGGLA